MFVVYLDVNLVFDSAGSNVTISDCCSWVYMFIVYLDVNLDVNVTISDCSLWVYMFIVYLYVNLDVNQAYESAGSNVTVSECCL